MLELEVLTAGEPGRGRGAERARNTEEHDGDGSNMLISIKVG